MGLGAELMAEAIANEGYNDGVRIAAAHWERLAENEEALSLALFHLGHVADARSAQNRRDGFRLLAALELTRLE